MSSASPEFRRELFTAVRGLPRDVRGAVRVPLAATLAKKKKQEIDLAEDSAAGHLCLDVSKHRLRSPIFTDPRRAVRRPND